MASHEPKARPREDGIALVQTGLAHVRHGLPRVWRRRGELTQEFDIVRSKAVSDGAISYYLEHFVTYRIAKATYGVPIHTRFNPLNPLHRARLDDLELGPAGFFFEDGFSPLVTKVYLSMNFVSFTVTVRFSFLVSS